MKLYVVMFKDGTYKDKAYLKLGYAKLGARQTPGAVVVEMEAVPVNVFKPESQKNHGRSDWTQEVYVNQKLNEKLKQLL